MPEVSSQVDKNVLLVGERTDYTTARLVHTVVINNVVRGTEIYLTALHSPVSVVRIYIAPDIPIIPRGTVSVVDLTMINPSVC